MARRGESDPPGREVGPQLVAQDPEGPARPPRSSGAAPPMPIRTRFEIRSSASRESCRPRTSPTISAAARFRRIPMRPVRQKRQASGQPTWVEMQAVSRASSGIRTLSTVSPSASPRRYFRVPSAARWAPRDRRPPDPHGRRQLLPDALRQIRHGLDACGPPELDPAEELPPPVGRLPQPPHEGLQLLRQSSGQVHRHPRGPPSPSPLRPAPTPRHQYRWGSDPPPTPRRTRRRRASPLRTALHQTR